MKQIQEVIRLVRECLDSGFATTELGKNSMYQDYVRFHVGDNAQYVADVAGKEPVEISIARRLMQGNLNLAFVAQDQSVAPQVLAMLKEVEGLTREVGFDFGKHGADLAFAHVIPELYTKEVLVFQNTIVITADDVTTSYFDPEKLDKKVMLAMNAAYTNEAMLELDALGAYRPVMKLTVPDLFDPVDTLQAIRRTEFRGVGELADYGKVELLEGIDPATVKLIGDSAVLRLDGKDYRAVWDQVQVIEGFKGEPAVEPKLEQKRSITSDGPSF
jgi:hypothetical protein